MDERVAQIMGNIIGLTDTITTMENMKERISHALTQKEHLVLESAIQMYIDARAQNLSIIGVDASVGTNEDFDDDDEDGENNEPVDSGVKQKEQVPPKEVKTPQPKTTSKNVQQQTKKKNEEYPD
jgi:hypothetical protein